MKGCALWWPEKRPLALSHAPLGVSSKGMTSVGRDETKEIRGSNRQEKGGQ